MPILIWVWRRFHKESGPPDVLQTREFRRVVEAVKAMKTEPDPFQNRDLLGAYLLYYWVLHYQQALSLIGELPHTPKRVLDVCQRAGAHGICRLAAWRTGSLRHRQKRYSIGFRSRNLRPLWPAPKHQAMELPRPKTTD